MYEEVWWEDCTILCYQDWLFNLQGPAQSENEISVEESSATSG